MNCVIFTQNYMCEGFPYTKLESEQEEKKADETTSE